MALAACRQISFRTTGKLMGDISIQFHALPDEVVTFAAQTLHDFRLGLVAVRLRPFSIEKLDQRTVLDFLRNEPTYRRWAFSLSEFSLSAANELEFADKNPDYLRLDVGVLTAQGLEQSWLSARTGNTAIITVWRKIAARLRGATQPGVIAVNRATGASSYLRSFRYTVGAKKLFEQGTPMLPPAGNTLLRFSEQLA